MLDIEVHSDDRVTVCRPRGELDSFGVSQLRQLLAGLTSATRLVFDLSEVAFIDSAGLGALIGGVRRIRERGGNASVACPRPALLRVLRTTGFDRIVELCPTLDVAVAALDVVA
jgi:anti-sigma B factor antagonist